TVVLQPQLLQRAIYHFVHHRGIRAGADSSSPVLGRSVPRPGDSDETARCNPCHPPVASVFEKARFQVGAFSRISSRRRNLDDALVERQAVWVAMAWALPVLPRRSVDRDLGTVGLVGSRIGVVCTGPRILRLRLAGAAAALSTRGAHLLARLPASFWNRRLVGILGWWLWLRAEADHERVSLARRRLGSRLRAATVCVGRSTLGLVRGHPRWSAGQFLRGDALRDLLGNQAGRQFAAISPYLEESAQDGFAIPMSAL